MTDPGFRASAAGPARPLRLEAFGGLRAAAAVLVIAYHVALGEGLTRAGPLAPLAAELKGGVTVFFVISGCLLYLPYARAIRDQRRLPDWRAYAHRRAVRILPAYWFALTVLGLASLAGSALAGGWWRYYGLTQIYNRTTVLGGLSVAWSLCVEATFYVGLPFFARWMGSLARRQGRSRAASSQLAVLAGVALISILLRGAISGSLLQPVPGPGIVLETALPGALDWFAVGISLAVLAATWEVNPERFRRLGWLARHGGLSWILAAALYTAGAWTQQGDVFLPLYGVSTHVALGLASGLVVLPAVRRDPGAAPVRLLSSPVLAWLGTVSYGMYLWHDAVLRILRGPATALPNHPGPVGDTIGLFLATAGGAIALGAASWYLIERPAQRLLRPNRLRGSIILSPEPGVTRP